MVQQPRWHRVHPWILGLVAVLASMAWGPQGVAWGQSKKGQNKPSYGLAQAPLEVYDRLSELKMGDVPALSTEERQLLAKAWELKTKNREGKFDEALLLDAMLFASGIEKADARAKYREHYDKLAAKAREAVKDAKNNRERGETLMTVLHKAAMNKGYESKQTSFATIFDTGKYNCVSSTALYYLVGSKLGLELKAISIPGSGFLPGHAALDMIEGGERIQVEPTNPNGFDWQTKLKRPGVVVFGFVPDRKDGHEVDGPGIAAMIYSNRGVAFAQVKPPQHLEAIRCYLGALALDPTDQTATNNLLAIFVNWGPDLSKEKKFEDAVRVLAFGQSIAPKSDGLRNNHQVVWSQYIEATLSEGRGAEALKIIERAAAALPSDREFRKPSVWITRHADKIQRDKGWEAALDAVETGLKLLPPDARKELLQERSSMYRSWSQSLLVKNDADGSLKVLARAYALDPKDREIIAGIGYHTQEALRRIGEKSGREAVIAHYKALREQFPDVSEVTARGAGYASWQIEKLANDKKFADAVAAIAICRPLFAKADQEAQAAAIAYGRWGRHLADKKDWQAALDKYTEGLKAYPKQDHLQNGALATVDNWAKPAMNAKNWDEAIRIYRVGLDYFPGDSHLLHNKDYCEKMKQRTK
ncbi:MAG: hypothetical protein HY040_11370 [Planctomycetes bacterium]|nr:hypothetical protein [Planctomycetota bacterium]